MYGKETLSSSLGKLTQERPFLQTDPIKKIEESRDQFLRQVGGLLFLGGQVVLFHYLPKIVSKPDLKPNFGIKFLRMLAHGKKDVLVTMGILLGIELFFNQSITGEFSDRKYRLNPAKWDLLAAAGLCFDGFSSGFTPRFLDQMKESGWYKKLITAGGRLPNRPYIYGTPIRGAVSRYAGRMLVDNFYFMLMWIPFLSIYIAANDAPLRDKLDYFQKTFLINTGLGFVRRSLLWRFFPKTEFGSAKYNTWSNIGYLIPQIGIMIAYGSRR